MVINLEKLKKYNKILNSFLSTGLDDFFYFDLEEKNIYFNNGQIALKLKVDIEQIENNFKVFMVSKQEFLHLLSCFSSITINPDYSYTTIGTQGKFHKNEKLLDTIDSIKIHFLYKEQEYEKYLSLNNSDILHKILKATIFTNAEDKNLQSRCVHFDNENIMSSSLNRLYVNKCSMDKECILNQNIIKYIFMLSEDTIFLYKKDKNFLLKDENSNIELLFVGIENVDLLSMKDERMQTLKDSIFAGKKITIETKELVNKLDFIKFYSMLKPNNMTHLLFKDNILKFEVEETNIVVDCKNDKVEQFDFYFNSIVLLEIIQKLAKDKEYIDLYTIDNSMIFVVSLEGEFEYVIISKINV